MLTSFRCFKAVATVALLGVCVTSSFAQSLHGKTREQALKMGLEKWIAHAQNTPAGSSVEGSAAAYKFYLDARVASNAAKWAKIPGGLNSAVGKAAAAVNRAILAIAAAKSSSTKLDPGNQRLARLDLECTINDTWNVFLSKKRKAQTTVTANYMTEAWDAWVMEFEETAKTEKRSKEFAAALKPATSAYQAARAAVSGLGEGDSDFMRSMLAWAMNSEWELPK